ncbi:Transcription initiation factor TFIID subunit 12 [Gaertneriomyces sp. JEL0708]|nr:Transcription initiation factor TFIID subunit 12 [Gaertneriomyces sp. JEL0708]
MSPIQPPQQQLPHPPPSTPQMAARPSHARGPPTTPQHPQHQHMAGTPQHMTAHPSIQHAAQMQQMGMSQQQIQQMQMQQMQQLGQVGHMMGVSGMGMVSPMMNVRGIPTSGVGVAVGVGGVPMNLNAMGRGRGVAVVPGTPNMNVNGPGTPNMNVMSTPNMGRGRGMPNLPPGTGMGQPVTPQPSAQQQQHQITQQGTTASNIQLLNQARVAAAGGVQSLGLNLNGIPVEQLQQYQQLMNQQQQQRRLQQFAQQQQQQQQMLLNGQTAGQQQQPQHVYARIPGMVGNAVMGVPGGVQAPQGQQAMTPQAAAAAAATAAAFAAAQQQQQQRAVNANAASGNGNLQTVAASPLVTSPMPQSQGQGQVQIPNQPQASPAPLSQQQQSSNVIPQQPGLTLPQQQQQQQARLTPEQQQELYVRRLAMIAKIGTFVQKLDEAINNPNAHEGLRRQAMEQKRKLEQTHMQAIMVWKTPTFQQQLENFKQRKALGLPILLPTGQQMNGPGPVVPQPQQPPQQTQPTIAVPTANMQQGPLNGFQLQPGALKNRLRRPSIQHVPTQAQTPNQGQPPMSQPQHQTPRPRPTLTLPIATSANATGQPGQQVKAESHTPTSTTIENLNLGAFTRPHLVVRQISVPPASPSVSSTGTGANGSSSIQTPTPDQSRYSPAIAFPHKVFGNVPTHGIGTVTPFVVAPTSNNANTAGGVGTSASESATGGLAGTSAVTNEKLHGKHATASASDSAAALTKTKSGNREHGGKADNLLGKRKRDTQTLQALLSELLPLPSSSNTHHHAPTSSSASSTSTMSATPRLTPESTHLLLRVADDFLVSLLRSSCRAAKHRGSKSLGTKDVILELERMYNLRIPGYIGEVKGGKKAVLSAHAARLAVLAKKREEKRLARRREDVKG